MYIVVKFDADGMVLAVPATWVQGKTVQVPPLSGKRLTTAIMGAIPLMDNWEGYPAKCIMRAGKF